VSDIDTVLVASLKALDPERPIREADIRFTCLTKDNSHGLRADFHDEPIRENGRNSLPIGIALHFGTPSIAFAAAASAPSSDPFLSACVAQHCLTPWGIVVTLCIRRVLVNIYMWSWCMGFYSW
jgi:hypothetical protein